MKALLKQYDNYDEVIGDNHAFDCTIRNKDFFVFFMSIPESVEEQEDEEYEFNDAEVVKRVVGYYRLLDDEPLFNILGSVTNMPFPQCEMTYDPLAQVICYTGHGGCVSIGSGESAIEASDEINGAGGSCVINDKIYVALSLRQVKYRVDEEEWVSVGNDISMELDGSDHTSYGFDDIDGFDENHIYAVGGDGDVWRCIDNKWIQCGFPTNLNLDVVCCGEDGNVYISGTSSDTYYGNEDSWKKVTGIGSTLPFNDMVWHDGKVWCTNDYGIWWITDGTLQRADIPSEVSSCAGSLCARFGLLLVAGLDSVYEIRK